MLYTIVTKEPVAAQLITLHNLWFMLLLGRAAEVELNPQLETAPPPNPQPAMLLLQESPARDAAANQVGIISGIVARDYSCSV